MGLFSPVFATDTTSDGQAFSTGVDALNVIHKNITITGGTFTGATTIGTDGSISDISGTTKFNQKNGESITNDGTITSISGGTFGSISFKNDIINNGTIGTISGGTFKSYNPSITNKNIINTISGKANFSTVKNDTSGTITSIEGGTFAGANSTNKMGLDNHGTIKSISGGTFTPSTSGGTTGAVKNQKTGVIEKITGGTFAKTSSHYGLENLGKIYSISNASDTTIPTFTIISNGTSSVDTAEITEISGGKVTSRFDNYAKIGTISGGEFSKFNNKKKGTSTTGGVITTISGGKFTNAFSNEDGANITTISGGEFTFSASGSSAGFKNLGIIDTITNGTKIVNLVNGTSGTATNAEIKNITGGSFGSISGSSKGFENYANIGTISGGEFKYYFNNGYKALTASQANFAGTVAAITGGTFTKFINSAKSTVTEISGGTFNNYGTDAAIINSGTITTIKGDTTSIATLQNAVDTIADKNSVVGAGTITTISGGTITTLKNEFGTVNGTNYQATIGIISGGKVDTIENSGIINTISGGTITTLNNNDTADTTTKATISSITDGDITTLTNAGVITDINIAGDANKNKIGTLTNTGSVGITAGTISELNHKGGTLDIKADTAKITTLNNESTLGEITKGDISTLNNKTGGTVSIAKDIANVNNEGGTINDIKASISGKLTNTIGTIDKISSGTIASLDNSATITSIAGGTITALDNKSGGVIADIAGGTFTNAITNAGEISKISANINQDISNTGKVTVAENGAVTKITNNAAEATATIKGGTVTKLDNTNGAVILEGGEVTTLNLDSGTLNITNDAASITTLNNKVALGTLTSGTITTLNNESGASVSIAKAIANVDNKSGGTINDIAANIDTKLTNSGTIDKISSGTIAALENSAKISDIVGGTVTTLTNNSGGVVDISGTLNGKIVNSGTVNFTMKTANTLGKLVGTFENKDGGKVGVDVQGATLAQKYTFIEGTQTGLSEAAFEIKNPNAQYLTLALDSDFTSVTLTKSEKFEEDFGGGGTQDASQGTSQISNRYALATKLLTSNADIANTSAVADADSSIKESYVSNPKAILSSFKAGAAAATPLGMGAISAGIAPNGYKTDLMSKAFNKKSKLLASTDLVMTDGIEPLNPFEDESLTELFVTPFGGGLSGSGVSGFMAGVNLGLVKATSDYAIQGVLSYGYGSTKQDLSTQSTDTTGHIFGVGFASQFYLVGGLLEADINANFTLGKFDLDNVWVDDSSLNSSSNFTNYQGNLGLQIGPRYAYLNDKLSTKVFIGVQNYYESQGKFEILGFQNEGYNDYTLNGVAGLEERIMLGESAFIFGRAGYEFRLYNSTKEVFMRDATNELKYENASNKGILTANIGGQIHAADSLKLGIEGIYKHYNTGLNYFGGSVNVRFVF